MAEDLEPEIIEIIRDGHGDNAYLVGVDQALKRFKAQIKDGKSLPTNPELRKFLDKQGLTISQPDDSWYDDNTWRGAKDATLLFVIAQLDHKLAPPKLRSILCERHDRERPLVQKAIEHSLWRSVALMMDCGASLDPEIPLEKVVESSRASSISANRISREEQDMLDLSTSSTALEEQYYTLTSTDSLPCKPQPSRIIKGLSWDWGSIHALRRVLIAWQARAITGRGSNWFHIPYTNGLIIKAIITAIESNYEAGSTFHPERNPRPSEIFYDHFRLSSVAPGDPYLTYREVTYWSKRFASVRSRDIAVIVFPTLMLTTLGVHKDNRERYKAMRDCMSTKVAGKYSSSCTAHLERTLDEAYFPGLTIEDFDERNKDQVVSKNYEKCPARRPIVVVPQLWLWQFGNTLISAHGIPRESKQFYASTQPSARGDRKIWQPRASPTAPQIKMACLIAHYVKAFGNEGLTLPDKKEVPPALDLFERQVVKVLSDVKTYIRTTPQSRIVYVKEEGFHLSLSDCRSELAMIQHILTQQKGVIDAFCADLTRELKDWDKNIKGKIISNDHEDEEWRLTSALDQLHEAEIALKQYQERILKIDGDADRVEKNVQDLLNLKRTYASVQDSHASVLLGVAAGAFAIVTIFFAPLAFLTALFALKVQGFDRLYMPSTDDKVTLNGTIGGQNVSVGANTEQADSVYDGGKMAGILVSSVAITFIVTGLIVWLSMKYFRIELSDLRFERQRRPEAEKKDHKDEEKDAEKKELSESSSMSSTDSSDARTAGGSAPAGDAPQGEMGRTGVATGSAEVRKRSDDLEAQRGS